QLRTTNVTRRVLLLHSHRLLAPSSAACPFHAAAIQRWATRQTEHQPVLMWWCVRTTRFTEETFQTTEVGFFLRCMSPLLALSGHGFLRRICPFMAQSGDVSLTQYRTSCDRL